MVEIVAFPTPTALREAALERLAGRVAAHMASVFLQAGLLDIPVQRYARAMCDEMLGDGFDYNPAVLDFIGSDPETLQRIEALFIRTLVRAGVIS